MAERRTQARTKLQGGPQDPGFVGGNAGDAMRPELFESVPLSRGHGTEHPVAPTTYAVVAVECPGTTLCPVVSHGVNNRVE